MSDNTVGNTSGEENRLCCVRTLFYHLANTEHLFLYRLHLVLLPPTQRPVSGRNLRHHPGVERATLGDDCVDNLG